MTKEMLKQYRFCKKRIRELDCEINKLRRENEVSDVVQGSQRDYPYVMHSTKVIGVPDLRESDSNLSHLYAERTKCKRIVRNVSAFVYSIDDAIIRRAFVLKYMEGETSPKWDKVAMDIGGGNTADGIRMAVSRYIDKL